MEEQIIAKRSMTLNVKKNHFWRKIDTSQMLTRTIHWKKEDNRLIEKCFELDKFNFILRNILLKILLQQIAILRIIKLNAVFPYTKSGIKLWFCYNVYTETNCYDNIMIKRQNRVCLCMNVLEVFPTRLSKSDWMF